MPFMTQCPDCGKVLNVPDSAAGKNVKCPACTRVWQIFRPAGGGQPIVAATPQATAVTNCPGCARAIQITNTMMGKRVRCPACATVWQVPRLVVDAEVIPEPQAKQEWYDDAMSDEYPIAANQPGPATPQVPLRTLQSARSVPDRGFFAPERKGISKGVMGGFAMMAIAAIWFFAGLYVGLIFYYPPILFVIGLYAVLKGILTGNLAGD
jgi:ribosomal protein S27E